jgi:hypothetical protein
MGETYLCKSTDNINIYALQDPRSKHTYAFVRNRNTNRGIGIVCWEYSRKQYMFKQIWPASWTARGLSEIADFIRKCNNWELRYPRTNEFAKRRK